MEPTTVKICGLTRPDDALAAVAAGADWLGVIFAPGSRRLVTPAQAAEVLRDAGSARRVGVFVDAADELVLQAAEGAKLDVLQLHGDETPDRAAELRGSTGLMVWKAVRPRTGADVAEALARFAGAVDGLLFDGWSPAARGGTGTRFPWEALLVHRDQVPPGLLIGAAGGIVPENAAEATRRLRPHVIDVASGVESEPGIKDHVRLYRLLAAVRTAAHEPLPFPHT